MVRQRSSEETLLPPNLRTTQGRDVGLECTVGFHGGWSKRVLERLGESATSLGHTQMALGMSMETGASAWSTSTLTNTSHPNSAAGQGAATPDSGLSEIPLGDFLNATPRRSRSRQGPEDQGSGK